MLNCPQSLGWSVVAMALSGSCVAAAAVPAQTTERALFEFDTAESAAPWTAVNDTVMGGVSSGACRRTQEGALEFFGVVSLENNGGFASVRAGTRSLDLSAFDNLVIRVRGDGKRYAISVQTDYRIMAGAYYYAFQTNDRVWQEIHAPLAAFEARSFGRVLSGAPPLNKRDIRSLGFIISDKQEGPFRIEVDWIKAAGGRQPEAPHEERIEESKSHTTAVLIETAIRRGAPMFNAGQPEACAAVYEIAARCIVGLAGRDLPSQVVETLQTGLAEAERSTDAIERAWALRRAFDTSLRELSLHKRGE